MKSTKMKRLESKKSHSWWWDSHVNPKNSKWLQENLEEMDQHVKRMLKLIEEDGDSFSKKVEMYYQKRPELINLVEDLYRMYRSLAERYDNVTGELRKSIPSDLQSQGSGISDVGSEPPYTVPSPGLKQSRSKPGTRAAGFDFFLGSGGSASDLYSKEGDESSTLDSDSESENSSVNNYSSTQSNDEEYGLRRKIGELEIELREAKEKLQVQREEIYDGSYKKHIENSEISAKVATYEEELRTAKENIRRSEEEITRLKIEVEKYNSMGDSNSFLSEDATIKQSELEHVKKVELTQLGDFEESKNDQNVEVSDGENKIQMLRAELRITDEKLRLSEEKVASLREELTNSSSTTQNLQHQLKSTTKEVSGWKNKFEKEKSEVLKMMDRISRYKNSLSDREQEIRGLKESISNANKSLSEENEQLQAEITKMSKEKHYLVDNLKEIDLRCQFLEEDVRRLKSGNADMQTLFDVQIQQLKADIAERNDHVEELNKTLDTLKIQNNILIASKDGKISELSDEMRCREDQIDKINKDLHQLQMEHAEVISSAEKLRARIKELETEVHRQLEIIHEGAEGKREAIRQLCSSLEHYRDGYHQLRQAVFGHKRLSVTAS